MSKDEKQSYKLLSDSDRKRFDSERKILQGCPVGKTAVTESQHASQEAASSFEKKRELKAGEKEKALASLEVVVTDE